MESSKQEEKHRTISMEEYLNRRRQHAATSDSKDGLQGHREHVEVLKFKLSSFL